MGRLMTLLVVLLALSCKEKSAPRETVYPTWYDNPPPSEEDGGTAPETNQENGGTADAEAENSRAESVKRELSLSAKQAKAWYSESNRAGVQGGSCAMSCHTTLPFILSFDARDASSLSIAKELTTKVSKRVESWSTAEPHYAWAKKESYATEAILNMVALVAFDQKTKGRTSERACKAISEAIQTQKTAFLWMNAGLAPYEDKEGLIWAKALSYIALAKSSRMLSDVVECGGSDLQGYMKTLNAELSKAFKTSSIHEKIWISLASRASSDMKILSESEEAELFKKVLALARIDEGYSSIELRKGEGQTAASSDMYATSLVGIYLSRMEEASSKKALSKIDAWILGQSASAIASRSPNKPGTTFNDSLATDIARGYFLLYQELKESSEGALIR